LGGRTALDGGREPPLVGGRTVGVRGAVVRGVRTVGAFGVVVRGLFTVGVVGLPLRGLFTVGVVGLPLRGVRVPEPWLPVPVRVVPPASTPRAGRRSSSVTPRRRSAGRRS
jgi:hypothetical protein